jgi:hypothetical protein
MQQHKDYMVGLLHHTAPSYVAPYHVKGKAFPLHAKKAQRWGRGTDIPIFNPGTWSNQVVTAIPQGMRPGTHCTGNWVGLGAYQDGRGPGKSCPLGVWTLDHLAGSELLHCIFA